MSDQPADTQKVFVALAVETLDTIGKIALADQQDGSTRSHMTPAKDRLKLRNRICLTPLVLFSILVLALLASAMAEWLSDDRIEKLAGVLISPASGLLGVVGFYDGEQARVGL